MKAKNLLCFLLIAVLFLPRAAAAEDVTACELTLSGSLDAQTGIFTLHVNMTKVQEMRFMQFSVSYDEAELIYVEDSVACGITALPSPTLNHCAGELLFAWDDVNGVDAEGVVLTARFNVNNENGLVEETSFTASLEALNAGAGIIGSAVDANWNGEGTALAVKTGYLYGDADCDGDYDVQDAVFLCAAAEGNVSISMHGRINAQIGADASPAVGDALRLAKGLVFS